MLHVGIFGVLFSFVSGVDQQIEPMRIEFVRGHRQQMLFVEHHHFMHGFAKRIEKLTAFRT